MIKLSFFSTSDRQKLLASMGATLGRLLVHLTNHDIRGSLKATLAIKALFFSKLIFR